MKRLIGIKKWYRRWWAWLCYGAVFLCVISFSSENKIVPVPPVPGSPVSDKKVVESSDFYSVVKVIDGDTITVSRDGASKTLRLIGMNTPETVDPRSPVECFGKEASDKAKSLLSGQSVRLEADLSQGELDKYNRLLRYVFLTNGTLYNQVMIEQGYAYEYTYGTPYKYQTQFKQAELQARKSKKGLWADGVCLSTKTTPAQKQTGQTVNGSGDKDCKDFNTRQEAQDYFDSRGGSPNNNIDRLDGSDHDGIVCESLP